MRVVFDLNVIFDVFFEREPFLEPAIYLFDQVEAGRLTGLITATAVTTLFYTGRKRRGRRPALRFIQQLMSRFEVAPVSRAVIDDALDLGFKDFEDAIVHEAGRHAGADLIVTRNGQDFEGASLPIYAPVDLVQLLRAQEASQRSGRTRE